jgi:hypothetical protein|nr:MAG: hypothetical protein [Caudoviricetes sp.]
MKYITMLFVSIALVGCSTVAGYKPTLNEKADKNLAKADEDFVYCQQLASKTAGYATEGVEDAIVAASAAAAIGAVSGAIITGAASAGVGAAAGGAIGGITGLWYGMYEADETYKRSFNSCMSQMGHPVLW